MSVERWDNDRKRWILYENQAEHSADCAAHPYEAVPGRIFLDTNVVNLLVRFPDQVFDGEPTRDELDQTTLEDIEALMHIFFVGRRANWVLAASHKTISEIEDTPDERLRSLLKSFAMELISPDAEENRYAATVGRRMVDAPFAAALPDLADRELIGNAIGLGCDAFCTRDRRTIIRRRETLRLLPLKVLTPLEWWRHVKPWAGLCM